MRSEAGTPNVKAIAAEAKRKVGGEEKPASGASKSPVAEPWQIEATLLTGGGDRPYAYGLATELLTKGISLDIIGSDDLDFPELRGRPEVKFLNLRGSLNPGATFTEKTLRIARYYFRLFQYAFSSKPRVFHILWNNKLETFDRTLLMVYYLLLGKRIVLTIHNVNARKRDSEDSLLNRLTLRIQYHLADHLFVHSDRMQGDLMREFGVPAARITMIPFGLNNSVPNTALSTNEARQRLRIAHDEKVILFFGNIAPYKGLEYLVTAFQKCLPEKKRYRLIVAGKPKGFPEYWAKIQQTVDQDVRAGRILLRSDFIPDEETEIYFKAADILVLPYRYIYQSGVLFLGYSFGLPVLAADVGSLKEDIVEGATGFVFKPEDAFDLGRAIEAYFSSELYLNLAKRRDKIRDYATSRHSWGVVGERTREIYAALLGFSSSVRWSHTETPNV